jgi:primosomal protein N' (replication factor Y)
MAIPVARRYDATVSRLFEDNPDEPKAPHGKGDGGEASDGEGRDDDSPPAGPGAAKAVVPGSGDRVVGLAVNANLWRLFDYLWPASLGEPRPGQRVRAAFGRANRRTLAFVVDPDRRPGEHELKSVGEVIDAEPQLDEVLWKLGQWISGYYLTPLGMSLAAMIPSAVGRHAARTEAVARLISHHADWPATLGPRQKRVLDELYEARKQGVEPVAVGALTRASGCSRDSINRLARRELISVENRPVVLPELSDAAEADPFELNADQQAAMTALSAKLDAGGFSVTLLHGVTGSGKTEVYVRAIRQVIAAGRQAILMAPEIALATQTLQRLLRRLPRVAVLHSGLTDAQRAFYYQQIRDGAAAVVVGPRSAVFAPTRKLGLIIVDEEHESSYKQDTAPPYHGRDTAVKRAQLAEVPIVLGSATPSLESMHNVETGRYDLLSLPSRVKGLPMPKLQIVHLRKELTAGKVELIGATLTHRLAETLDRGEQAILLMNRRGYASYVFCPSCKWMYECEHCSRPMIFHQATQMCMCHYCQASSALPEHCPACSGKLLLFGLGIQRIEGELARKFPQAKLARMDSDTMTTPGQFRKVFDAFGAGELDILLGTQMVGKGLDFPRVSLVGIVSADTSLIIPDFRASERTFQLIVQVAGRAGRAEMPGQVVVQTLHADEPAIRFATTHDYKGFAAWELPLRKEAHLPPYARLVRFIVRHENVDRASAAAAALAAALRPHLPADVVFWGPDPAAIKRIRDKFRFQILLIAARPGVIQTALAGRMERIVHDIPAEVLADADPVSLA